ncbi:MAG: B12-binding domain-containing radical SAM protein [Armatimonadota bacterium]
MKIRLVAPAVEKYLLQPGERSKEVKTFRFSLLGLLAVAACTPEEHEIEIIDEHIEHLDFADPVDLVGVTFMTAHAPRAYAIGDAYLRRGVPVVFGGFHPSFLPEEALEHCSAVVVGEAEPSWPQLLRDLQQDALQPIYRSAEPADLTMLRTPPRQLLKRREYFTINTVQATRGCQNHCEFCSVQVFHGSRFRQRPVEAVVEEIAGIRDQHVIMIDDNLIGNPGYAKELFRAMAPLRKRWVTQASILLAEDEELLTLAARAGCRGVFIGFETINARNLAAIGKEFNRVDGYRTAVTKLHDHGIGVEAGVMFGFDGDDVSVFARTLEFLDDIRIDAMQASIVTPLPGTPYFTRMQEAGRMIDLNWRNYDYRHTVFQPAGMAPEELQQGVDWIIREFYSLPRIIRRTAHSLLRGDLMSLLLLGLPVNVGYYLDSRRYPSPTPEPESNTLMPLQPLAGLR